MGSSGRGPGPGVPGVRAEPARTRVWAGRPYIEVLLTHVRGATTRTPPVRPTPAYTQLPMPGIVLVGAQWGDEGKGKVTDLLAERADAVVRFQGGNNAGHTIVRGGKTSSCT